MDYFYKYKGQDIKVSLGKKLSYIDLNQGKWTKYVNNKEQIKAILIKMKHLIDTANNSKIIKMIVLVFMCLYIVKCANMACEYRCVRTINGSTQPPSWVDTCYPVNCKEVKK